MKVIFRKDKTTNEVMAFLPSVDVRWGNIMMYRHNGQHQEVDLLFYKNETIKCDSLDYYYLYKELSNIYNERLIESKRLHHKDLFWVNK